MSGKIKHLDDSNFQAETSNGVFLVDFYADWCGPCRMMTPVIEEFAEKRSGSVSVGKLDIDASPDTTQRHGVTSIPTLILFNNGQPVGTFVGLKDLPQLEQLVDGALN